MLSPHEIAALMLVRDAGDYLTLDDPDLGALLKRKLVELDRTTRDKPKPRLTRDGDFILKAIAEVR